jgi:hypothetical protein
MYRKKRIGAYTEIMAILPMYPFCDIARIKVYGYHTSHLPAIEQWFDLSKKTTSRRINATARATSSETHGPDTIARKIRGISNIAGSIRPKYRHYVFPRNIAGNINLDMHDRIVTKLSDMTPINFYHTKPSALDDLEWPIDLNRWHRQAAVWGLMLDFLKSLTWPLTEWANNDENEDYINVLTIRDKGKTKLEQRTLWNNTQATYTPDEPIEEQPEEKSIPGVKLNRSKVAALVALRHASQETTAEAD